MPTSSTPAISSKTNVERSHHGSGSWHYSERGYVVNAKDHQSMTTSVPPAAKLEKGVVCLLMPKLKYRGEEHALSHRRVIVLGPAPQQTEFDHDRHEPMYEIVAEERDETDKYASYWAYESDLSPIQGICAICECGLTELDYICIQCRSDDFVREQAKRGY